MFLVMRTHSTSTDRRGALWQVSSRPFDTREMADGWCDFLQTEYLEETPRGLHKFFVIETEVSGVKV